MPAFTTESIVREDGSLTVESVPFRAGERVEVSITPVTEQNAGDRRYPLQGTPYRYDDPTLPVAEADWEAAS